MGFSFGITDWRGAYRVADDDESGERSQMYLQLQSDVKVQGWTMPSGEAIDWVALLSISGASSRHPHYGFPYSFAGHAVQSALETLRMPGGTYVDVLPFEVPSMGIREYSYSITFHDIPWAVMTASHIHWAWDLLPASFQREVEETFATFDLRSDVDTIPWRWAVGAFVDLAHASLETGLPARLQW